MAQKAHVPKFGNWDSDNIPYTAYFEKARRDKSKGDHEKVIMNPNDPEDNPEAFLAMEMTLNRNNSNSQLPPLPHVSSSTTSSNYRRSRRKMSNNYYGSQNNIYHDQSIPSTTTTERSSSDSSNSLQQRISRRSERSDRNNKSTTYASDDYFSAASHIRHSSGSTNSHSIDHQQRAASIPKFGTWDETDPKSGENFTIIFNKVKEEKQNMASAQFSTPFNPPHAHNQRARSYASKICCCLF